jgi:hypothetical protein
MDYMLAQFIWFVLIAFVMGACVGWFTCRGSED